MTHTLTEIKALEVVLIVCSCALYVANACIDFIFTGVGVVNTIKWTSGLDKYFKENEMKNHSLLWQYFGSADGVYRVYPGKITCYVVPCFILTPHA